MSTGQYIIRRSTKRQEVIPFLQRAPKQNKKERRKKEEGSEIG